MQIINSKTATAQITLHALDVLAKSGRSAFLQELQNKLLKQKVRFPALEHAAAILCDNIPVKEQVEIADAIIDLGEIGSYVLAGMILQKRLEKHLNNSISKAVEYIITGNEWYVCDIVGERVMGYALLTFPEKTLPVLQKLAKHKDKWIVRSVGVATHYAVKKGLKKQYVDEMFRLLLSLAGVTDFHTKKGVGWAAKTITKFHPEIVAQYEQQVNEQAKQWFKTKIKIGLGRTSKYAHRYTG